MSEEEASSTEEESSASSIHQAYHIDDYDEDEDEDEEDIDLTEHSKELLELKDQTTNLLDSKWKEDRNLYLLNKMLQLEEPTISAKMVDFLLQPGVCESLTDFITQIGTSRRPFPTESISTEMKFSYRSTMLLSVEEPSDALLLFLSKKASVIAKHMFDIFRDDSAGSFYHAARIIESLLRVYPGEVFEGLLAEGLLEERMAAILRYIGYPPVGDLLVILVALTPISRTSPVYKSCTKSRFAFIVGLAKWDFLLRLARIVSHPAETCRLDEYISAEQHCDAAAQTFNELVEKLSSEDIAQVLLQPLGHSPQLLQGFVDRATGMSGGCKDEECAALEASDSAMLLTSQEASLRLLIFLLKKSSCAQNPCFVMGVQGQPVQTMVPNQLYPLRPMMVAYLATRVDELRTVMVESNVVPSVEGRDEGGEGVNESVVLHPGHVCQNPFSVYRSQLVELFVLLVEASASPKNDDDSSSDFCEHIPADFWMCMISWVFEYAHNNIYHAMFYRVLFALLRQNNEVCLRNLFKSARLVTYMIEGFEPFEEAFDKDYDESNDITMVDKHFDRQLCISLKDRNALRGLLVNCCNAIRLQVSCLPPTSFLRNYLHSHSAWNQFLPALHRDTLVQQPSGLGRYVPSADTKPGPNNISALMSLKDDEGEGTNHGSTYAKFLGFEEEIEWPEDSLEPKKKKKGKKKKKNKNRRRGGSDLSDDMQDGISEDDESEGETDRRASIGTDGSGSSGEEELELEENEAEEVSENIASTADLGAVD